MLKVFGSPHCPDCVACKAILEKNHIPFEYIDITGSIRALKQFLALIYPNILSHNMLQLVKSV